MSLQRVWFNQWLRILQQSGFDDTRLLDNHGGSTGGMFDPDSGGKSLNALA